MIDRRCVLAGAAALAQAPLSTARAAPNLRQAARDAWIYALPLIEFGRAFQRARTGARLNTISHVPFLGDHTSRTVTTPNNDTLYASARLDLAAGPVSLTVPPGGERYVSVALMDAYTNNFAVLGARATPDGGTFRLVAPGSPQGSGVIVSPTRYVWVLGRTLVSGPQDLAAALAFSRRITLAGPEAPPPPEVAARDAPWRGYFASADLLMRLNPPPVADRPFLTRIAALGLGRGFDGARFTAAQAAEIERGVAEAKAQVRAGLDDDRPVDGWFYSKPGRGDFGTNYMLRASVALGGLATLPAEEAMYMRAVGDGRGVFSPGRDWRLTFPANRRVPARAFWSLSLYEATPDGQFFFTENPLRRYAIGDRTPGVTVRPTGELDIWITRDDPGPGRRSNWLPAPADKPFALVLRAYLPEPGLRNGRYRLPPLQLLDDGDSARGPVIRR